MKTIKSKVMVLLIVCLTFIGALHVLYYNIIFSLEKKMVLIEKFDDFRDDILELRRYEKNFVFLKDLDSLNTSIYYLSKTEDSFNELTSEIKRIAGPIKYQQFYNTLFDYKKIIGKNMAVMKNGKRYIDIPKIRNKGKQLVDFANELIEIKRPQIKNDIKQIMTIPLAFLISFVIFAFLIFQLIGKGILKPLALMQRATEEAAKGTFAPVAYEAQKEDEVVRLIETFNEMTNQLNTKQKELLQSRKMASIGTFTSGIAHELNNPLNNISLTAESLIEEFSVMSQEESLEMIKEILSQTDRASKIVENLLEFSRKERPFLLEVNINDVLEHTIKLTRNQLMITGIQLKKDISNILPSIRGRQQDLQQAFLNLILNSIQAIEDMLVENVISVRSGPGPDGYIRIDFSDTGTGIKPEHLDHIFDPFYTTKPIGQGTGLGLSLVYGIIRSHGGYIEVKSEINKGTTFSIYLPIAENNKEESTDAV